MVEAFCELLLKTLGMLLSTRLILKSKSTYRDTVLKRGQISYYVQQKLEISVNLIDYSRCGNPVWNNLKVFYQFGHHKFHQLLPQFDVNSFITISICLVMKWSIFLVNRSFLISNYQSNVYLVICWMSTDSESLLWNPMACHRMDCITV